MVEQREERAALRARWWPGMELTSIVAVCALVLSGLGFYRSYIYEKQALDITVTEVSYATSPLDRKAHLIRKKQDIYLEGEEPTRLYMVQSGQGAEI